MTAAARRVRPALAFFDVDETLIADKSLVAFWTYWSASHPGQRDAGGLRTEAAATRDRRALNRAYYRRYTGVPLAALEAAGRRWYDDYRRGEDPFVLPVLEAVETHRAAGREVVLVSGSMRPLLAPLAEELGVSAVLCTELLVTPDGRLTGEVLEPMIGEAKADAALWFMRERGADPDDCFAYGDHESDLALLRAVGRPVVVGNSPRLKEEARRFAWPVLPARRGPLRAASV
jgi:HAD superfamily hydrolase (TIGR01490 family)